MLDTPAALFIYTYGSSHKLIVIIITYVFWNGIPMEIEFGGIVRLTEFLKMTSVCKT